MVALALTPMTAFAAEGDWTYDAGAKTLTNDDGVVLTNVVANGTDLTIGQQTDDEDIDDVTTLDLSGSITGADGGAYTVACLDEFAFYSCTDLASVALPAGLTSIYGYTFYGCSALMSIDIPDGVTEIGGYAFYGCASLISVELPESLTSIDDFAFYDCDNLISVYIEAPTSPKKLGDLAFPGGVVFEAIYVPAESVDDYKAAPGWSDYADKIKAWPRTLIVTNSTGRGLYSPGNSVTVAADDAPEGKHFAGWVVSDGGLALTDDQAKDAELTFTMPDADVTLEATFEDHRGGEATCVSAPICEVCGADYGEKDPNNHSYVDGVCTRCGAAEPDAGSDPVDPGTDPDDPGTGSGGQSTGDSGHQDTAGGKDTGDQDAERADGTLAQTGDASIVAGPLLAMALIFFAAAAVLRRNRG